jgi:inhibitor of cysteine peptidase
MKTAPRIWFAIALAVALAVAALAAGCAPTPVQLRSTEDGTVQTLAVGQKLKVSLDANPTTGYAWALDGPLPAQLSQDGEPTFTPSSGLTGAGGTEVWAFVGKTTGQGTLRLKYWRSFEPTTPPIDTFTVQVNVK